MDLIQIIFTYVNFLFSQFSLLSHPLPPPPKKKLGKKLGGAGMAPLLRDGPGFDSRWELCKNRASRPSQGTVNGGAVSKWSSCRWDVKPNQFFYSACEHWDWFLKAPLLGRMYICAITSVMDHLLPWLLYGRCMFVGLGLTSLLNIWGHIATVPSQ